MATRVTKHASPLLLQRGVRGVAGEPLEIVVHTPTAPALSALGFAVDSAFPGVQLLGALADGFVPRARAHPGARLMLFGHADETGGDSHNKRLADRRAKAVLALLTQDLAALDETARDDKWGVAHYQAMLQALGFADVAADGDAGPITGAALRRFQRGYHLGVYHVGALRSPAYGPLKCDGVLGPRSEAALRDAYLGLLPVSIPVARFMAPRTAGCGEFNRLGNAEQDRRVVLALYRPDFPSESKVPCKEGDAASCKLNRRATHRWKCNFYRRTLEPESAVPGRALAAPNATFASDFALRLTEQLAQALTVDAFALWGNAVFGADVPREALERLHADLRVGALANAPILVRRDLQGHLAAFDAGSGSVLLAESLVLDAVEQAPPAATLSCVLVEEFGHHLDHLLRNLYSQVGGDGPDDEGARFASLLLHEQLAQTERFAIGTLQTHEGRTVHADWQEQQRALRDALGPHAQATDGKAGDLEFSDASVSSGPSESDAREILYVNLLLAGCSLDDAHTLIDIARKLQDRWRGRSGTPVLYETGKPGKPGPALERVLLQGLLTLYGVLDARIKAAPLAADGLPDLGESSWTLSQAQSVWDRQSPLAGIVDDIVPFGEKQDWLGRLSQLAPRRKARRREVREQYIVFEDEPPLPDAGAVPDAGVHVPGAADAAAADPAATPVDDALNTTDRLVAGVDTALELLGVEVLAGMGLALSGAALGLLTTLSGILVADKRQEEAAKAIGILFAWFAIRQAADETSPPVMMIVEDVLRRAEGYPPLKALRDQQKRWRAGTPESTLDDGLRAGITTVIEVLNAELGQVDRRAAMAHEHMLLRVRIDYPGDVSVERRAQHAYALPWWRKQIRRALYVELAAKLQAPAQAVLARMSPKQ